jgi:hypothetical protein
MYNQNIHKMRAGSKAKLPARISQAANILFIIYCFTTLTTPTSSPFITLMR